MDVKWLVSSGRIENILKKAGHINKNRYNSFYKEFGKNSIGLVSMDSVINEIKTGKPSPVYTLGNNLKLNLSNDMGVNSQLFLASGFDLGKGKMTRRENLEEVMNYLELKKGKGDIGAIVNSKYSTLFEDKISFVGLTEKGIQVPLTYNFQNKKDFEDFIRENGKHVVKHRFGYDGVNNFLIDKNNLGLLEKEIISDYVVQEPVPIVSETRLIFYKDDFLGARKIKDRTRPWEEKEDSGRKHIIEKYIPSKEEIDRARSMFKYADGVVGAVDTVQLEDGTEKILEFNGVGTGLGYPGGVYDLNHEVAKRLRKSYVK